MNGNNGNIIQPIMNQPIVNGNGMNNIIPPQPPAVGRYRVVGNRSFPVYPENIEIDNDTIINILPNNVNVPSPGVSVGSIGNQRVIVDPNVINDGNLVYIGELNQVDPENGDPEAVNGIVNGMEGGRRRKTRNRRRNRKQKPSRKSKRNNR